MNIENMMAEYGRHIMRLKNFMPSGKSSIERRTGTQETKCKECRGTGYELQRGHAAMPPDKCKKCGGNGTRIIKLQGT